MLTRFARAEIAGLARPSPATLFTSSRCDGMIVMATLPAMMLASIAPTCRKAARPLSRCVSEYVTPAKARSSSALAIAGARGAIARWTPS